MSDTCCLVIVFRRDELSKFNEVLKDMIRNETFWDEDNGDEKEIIATIYEASYGWYKELEQLAEAGLTFYGNHSEGGDYEACVFAGHKKQYLCIPSNRYGYPVVCVGENLQVSPDELSDAKEYWKIYKEAQEYIEEETNNITSA